MQINGLNPTNRLSLDGLEPTPIARPPVALPPRPDATVRQAPEAAVQAGNSSPAEGPSSPVAIALDAAFKDLRASLGESPLANGVRFQPSAQRLTSDVLASPTPPASVNQPSPSPANAERIPNPIEPPPPPAERGTPSARAPEAAAERPAQDPARSLGDSTLGSLGATINLQAAAGRFQVDVNGQTLNFRADQTLNEVLAGISGPTTGARATLDPRGRITAESTTGTELSITDRRGNLASGLGIEVTPSENTNAALSRDLQDFAQGLNRALVALENRPGQPPPDQEAEAVLKDLESALNGLFATSPNNAVQTLGDLGFSRANGQVQLDAGKLDTLVANRPDEVNRVVASLFDENVQPMVQSGERVAQNLDASTAEARQATQEVRIRAEVARLQVRQQTLTLDRTATENLRERVSRQTEALAGLAEQLASLMPSGLSREAENAQAFAEQIRVERPRERPVIANRLPVPQPTGTSISTAGEPVAG